MIFVGGIEKIIKVPASIEHVPTHPLIHIDPLNLTKKHGHFGMGLMIFDDLNLAPRKKPRRSVMSVASDPPCADCALLCRSGQR